MPEWTHRMFLCFAMVMNFLWSWTQLMSTSNVHGIVQSKLCVLLNVFFG